MLRSLRAMQGSAIEPRVHAWAFRDYACAIAYVNAESGYTVLLRRESVMENNRTHVSEKNSPN